MEGNPGLLVVLLILPHPLPEILHFLSLIYGNVRMLETTMITAENVVENVETWKSAVTVNVNYLPPTIIVVDVRCGM